ncbi:MAG: hypothetical protein EBE86_011025 [Hormoscilla sp. GUM202]|nr:hypothetical protein [Hormoscilla sp. GUM202]
MDYFKHSAIILSRARAAGVAGAIAQLPYSYDTTLGNQFAQGEVLGNGRKSRSREHFCVKHGL